MNDDEVRAATEAERLSLADQLTELDGSEWVVPSLCEGWTVHDVAAHLASATRLSTVGVVVGLVKARGNLKQLIANSAREWSAAHPPEDVITMLRANAGTTRKPPGTTVRDPFVDVVVHGQDIARPLGRERVIPTDRAVAALEHVWSGSFFGASKRFAGLRFVATDADWSAGEGTDEVSGPAAELLMLSTCRSTVVGDVTGSGVAEARRRAAG